MGSSRKAMTPALATEWAQMAHVLYLDALMGQADWSVDDIAFHGGTSLRLSWNSSRYSEDLDFLLARHVSNLDKILRRVESTVREMARRLDPEFVIEIKDQTRDIDRMPAYMLSVSHPGWVGKARMKAEFWRTDRSYLPGYPTQLRTPQVRAAEVAAAAAPSLTDLYSITSNPVPAATLESAYADKLVAFATRPFLKWRDLYDLWWIGTQTPAALDLGAVCAQFLHNATAYSTLQGLPPGDALALFLRKDRAQVLAQADPDLKNWLPPNVWRRLQPDGVHQIVDYVHFAIETVSSHILELDRGEEADLKSVPARPRCGPGG